MKTFITYSDNGFVEQRNFAVFMANLVGNFDSVIAYKPEDIDKEFYELNQNILSQKKGGGFWLWKPYFIYKTLEKLNNNDFLFYADAGSFFLKNVDILIKELEISNQDIMCFELPLIESQWTKKELFINMNCEDDKFAQTNQIMASFFLIKKNDFSMKFFFFFLDYSCDEKNITDVFDNNILQSKEFIDHRQDQSIVSLLYKKYNLKPFKDPSQRGKFFLAYGGEIIKNVKPNILYKLKNGRYFRISNHKSVYSNIIFHYRRGRPLLVYSKYLIKILLYKIGLYNKLIF